MKRYHTARVVVHLKYTKESFQKFFRNNYFKMSKAKQRSTAAQRFFGL